MLGLIISFGYIAIFIGTFLEGETILILGGFLAHRGYLQIHWVILSAFLGSLIGDQIYFFIGRHRGVRVLLKHPNWKGKIDRFNRYLRKYNVLIILAFRFLYGLRTISPFAIGMSKVPTSRFVILNTVSALLWASLIGYMGYIFGHAVEIILGDIKRIEIAVIIFFAIVFLLVLSYKKFWKRKSVKK
jgi:membrane protein DedA with SNARE-associated domain